MSEVRPAAKLTLLDGLICAYLTLPLLIFSSWFKWPVAVVFLVLVALAFRHALVGAWSEGGELSKLAVGAICMAAVVWTALSGVGHFAFANLDWVTRDAVLRDLTATAWPPQYEGASSAPTILRAPVAYYLPAAALGSLINLQAADLLLYAWTVIGFALTLCGVFTLFPVGRQRWVAGALMLGFGGLDWIGTLWFHGRWPQLGEHIEWWALFAQYSSASTLMFWVPNHALPAWLGLILVLRHWRESELARLTPLLAAAIPLWSPLSAVGLAPFFLVGLNWRRDARLIFSIRIGLPLFAVAWLVSRYLTINAQTVTHGWVIHWFSSVQEFWHSYVTFCSFEFGLLALILIPLRAWDLKLSVAIVILLLLPFYRLGPGSDLMTRCSIPALAVLAFAIVRPLSEGPWSLWRCALVAMVAVGALGAAQEPERALMMPRWPLTGKTLGEISQGSRRSYVGTLPGHYVAELTRPELLLLMRTPTMVQPYSFAGPP